MAYVITASVTAGTSRSRGVQASLHPYGGVYSLVEGVGGMWLGWGWGHGAEGKAGGRGGGTCA